MSNEVIFLVAAIVIVAGYVAYRIIRYYINRRTKSFNYMDEHWKVHQFITSTANNLDKLSNEQKTNLNKVIKKEIVRDREHRRQLTFLDRKVIFDRHLEWLDIQNKINKSK